MLFGKRIYIFFYEISILKIKYVMENKLTLSTLGWDSADKSVAAVVITLAKQWEIAAYMRRIRFAI